MSKLVESVVNVSEGRDEVLIGDLAGMVREAGNARLLDVHSDVDHNRSVFTMVGDPENLLEAVLRLVRAATSRVDLRRHEGVHPRIGAVDVIPFTPLVGVTMEDCRALSRQCGKAIWEETGVPVYLYGESAPRPDRRELAVIRRGQFESLRERIGSDPACVPDFGEPHLHPSAGACAVGARPVLVAFNVQLRSQDLSFARRIAAAVRESGHGMPGVRALGFYLRSRSCTQVSMNLVDFRRTGPREVWDRIGEQCDAAGVAVADCEIVGLAPSVALRPLVEGGATFNGTGVPAALEDRVWEATGLSVGL